MNPIFKSIKAATLAVILVLICLPSFAQRKLGCPKPKKEKKYYEPIQVIDYLHFNLYGAYPIPYKTIDYSRNTDLKTKSNLGYAFNLQNYFVINHKLEWITEAMIAIYEKGVGQRFNIINSNNYFYTSLAQYRFSTGLSYNVTERINLSLMPSLVYNTNYGYTVGTANYGQTGFIGSMYTTDNNVWLLGANFYGRFNITKRFYFNVMSLVDFAPSSAMNVQVTVVDNNGVVQQASVHNKSYLLHVGMGLGYRIFQIKKK